MLVDLLVANVVVLLVLNEVAVKFDVLLLVSFDVFCE